MSKFNFHEIAVGQNFIKDIQWNGMECEIIGGLQEREAFYLMASEAHKVLSYKVKWMDGSISIQPEHNLKKKKPPQEQLKTWEELKKDLGMSEKVSA